MMSRLLSIFRCGRRADLERDAHAAIDRVEEEAAKLEQASKDLAESDDPIRDFVHGVNAERQRDNIKRGQ